jgi:hypothetical protein
MRKREKACWPRDALASNQGNWEINGRMGTGSTRAEDEITISMLEQITDHHVILAAAGKIGSLGDCEGLFRSGPVRRNRNVRLRGSGSDFSLPCHCLRHCTGPLGQPAAGSAYLHLQAYSDRNPDSNYRGTEPIKSHSHSIGQVLLRLASANCPFFAPPSGQDHG